VLLGFQPELYLNEAADREADRRHPLKRQRPEAIVAGLRADRRTVWAPSRCAGDVGTAAFAGPDLQAPADLGAPIIAASR
jgi:hypothetical protein